MCIINYVDNVSIAKLSFIDRSTKFKYNIEKMLLEIFKIKNAQHQSKQIKLQMIFPAVFPDFVDVLHMKSYKTNTRCIWIWFWIIYTDGVVVTITSTHTSTRE